MKKAVIVGASSGIGKELALLLAANGYTVGITGRREALLSDIQAKYPGKMHVAAFDATSENAAESLERLIETLGGMDLFVFCSGTGNLNPTLDYGIERNTNELNVEAFTRLTGLAYNYFAANGGGHLAAVSSIMGLRGSGAAPAYAASKAYQINYLEGLRQRSVKAKAGITVCDFRPGSVDTDMMKGEGHFWIATPEQAARTIYKGIAKKRSVQYVTPRWAFIGMILKMLPRPIYNRM